MQKRKQLSTLMLVALVIGNMIGSGVFLLPASLASYGSLSLIGWIFSGVGCICLALIFARIGKIITHPGGPYAYSRQAFGDFCGFQVAYIYWIYIWVGNAAIAISASGYLSYFFPEIARQPWLTILVTLGLVWLFTFINISGVKKVGTFQVMSVFIKLIPLISISLIGFFYIKPHYYVEFFNVSNKPTIPAILASMTLTMWALTGIESASIPTEYIDNPRQKVPFVTIAGSLISISIYIISSTLLMGIIPMHQLAHSSAPFAVAANLVFGNIGGSIIAVAAIFSSLGALNGWILLQGQIPYSAAQDKIVPEIFARQNRFQTPYISIIISSILISILILFNYHKDIVGIFNLMILLATVAILVVYWIVILAEFSLQMEKKEFNLKSFGTLNFIVSIVATIYVGAAIIGSGETIIAYGMILFLTGIPFYVISQCWKARKNLKS